jgi:hypothetical protein
MSATRTLDPADRAALRRAAASTHAADAAAPSDAAPAAHPMLALQRQLGNAQINRLLAQRAGGEEDKEDVQAKRDPAAVQRAADLDVARKDDEEQHKPEKPGVEEADKVPDAKGDAGDKAAAPAPEKKDEDETSKIAAKHDLAVQRELAQREGDDDKDQVQAKHDDAVQRRCADCPDAGDTAQRTPEVGAEGGPVSDAVAARIQASRGGGAPLDDGARAKMEDGFGTSFDHVRVHTGREADSLNRSLGAKAFTTGNDVYFRGDASPTDHTLLAHELTHVVQQRSMTGGGRMHVGPAGDAHEQQADGMAAAVASGSTAAAAQRRAES